MRTPRSDPIRIGLVIAALGLVAVVPSVAADVATAQCVTGVQEEPVVGDGPWIGDAPDDHQVPTTPSTCYNGQHLPYDVDPDGTEPVDADHYLLQPDRSRWLVQVEALQGCGNVSIELAVNGATTSERICAGDDDPTAWWGILALTQVDLTIEEQTADDDLVYMFYYE